MLRGASAEARTELASKVGSGTLEDTAKLGDQLLAVAGVLRSEPALRRVFRDGEEIPLSRKEFDVLAMLARNAGHVVRREDLMAEVWDENWWGSTRTLDVHVGTLRRKLGDQDGSERMIQTVRGVGFRLCPPEAGSSP